MKKAGITFFFLLMVVCATFFCSKEEPFKIILKFQYDGNLDKLSEPLSIDIGKGNPTKIEEEMIFLREETIL
jgi:hypothetical protein